MYDKLEFELVNIDEINRIKYVALKRCGANKFSRDIIENEFVCGNIYKIQYITESDKRMDGGYVNKQFKAYHTFTNGESHRNSIIYFNSIIIGNTDVSGTIISNSIIIGNARINDSYIRDSFISCQHMDYLTNFYAKRFSLIYDSSICNSKILYNKYFEIVESKCYVSSIKNSSLRHFEITKSVVRESRIGNGRVFKSYLRNINIMHNGFALSRNRVTSNDQIVVIGNIGSRNDRVTFVNQKDNIYVHTGCFHGDLEFFKSKLARIHGNTEYIQRRKYYEQYTAAIDFVLMMFEINNKEEYI